MAEIVNLRHARKSKARSEKEKTAANNRVRFGAAKRDRKLGAAKNEKALRDIEAHRLDQTGDEG